MADRVAVMYAGRIVELAPVKDLFADPRHPYTRGLMASMPGGTRGTRLRAIQGTVPPLGALPPGCSFTPRCAERFEPCPKAHPGDTLIDVAPRPSLLAPHASSDTSRIPAESRQVDGAGRRLQAEDLPPQGATHIVKCYLYSAAIEGEVRAEEPR
jgi:oligopeptide/dipeptide ABC transporter ATP-binding protein